MREDSFLHKGMRDRMCQELRNKGITDESVLKAMNAVPRHWFIDPSLENNAYLDAPLPIRCGQTISHPSTVAIQTQLLGLTPGMKVLEIGTGSGYQTAILCQMGARVFSIERQKSLFDQTKRLLYELRFNARCYLGDGYQGITIPDCAPFDRAIITCGAPMIPEKIMEQLKTGGVMVIPVGETDHEMLRITKEGEQKEDWKIEKFGGFRFVPMLEGKQF